MFQRLGKAGDAFGLSGADLRKYREAAGLSRRALAEQADCSPQWILQLEASAEMPRRSFVLPALLAALDTALEAAARSDVERLDA